MGLLGEINWKAQPNVTSTALSKSRNGRCVCECVSFTGSEFYQSSPNNVMPLKNAEAANLPMTHPSDFYSF